MEFTVNNERNYTMEKMKIMYLNPLGISNYDHTFADMAIEYKESSTHVTVTSLNDEVGIMNNLEYRTFENAVATDSLKAVRQAAKDGYDALIMGCFYDPEIKASREIAKNMFVIGPCFASIDVATKISNTFSIIVGRSKWVDQMKETVKSYVGDQYLVSFRDVGLTVSEFVENPDLTAELIIAQAILAVKEDKAEAIILGCTLEVGFYKLVQEALLHEFECHIPVIDASIAALKVAESAVQLKLKGTNWVHSRVHSMEAPLEADLDKFGLFTHDYTFGNIIEVPAETIQLPPSKTAQEKQSCKDDIIARCGLISKPIFVI